MTDREMFEEQYILDDHEYVKYCDDIEAYFIQKELDSYNSDTWLFEHPKKYYLEDDYGEESEP